MNFRIAYLLVAIFIVAILLRLLYFPNNIYFGFDQARDAFATQEILGGQLKIIGPPTSFEGLRHGVLYYYLYAPFYWIGNGDPAIIAAFLRVLNASGIILIFIIATILFNRIAGLISAWLFAVSFEQTQFAIYLNHPSFSVISILLMYLGLSLLIFRKKDFGLVIALLGLGLSIQFEFILTYLFIPFIIIFIVFRKSIPHISFKVLISGVTAFFLVILTFLAAEMKFSFRSVNLLQQLLFGHNEKSFYRIISTYLFEMGQVIKFNLAGTDQFKVVTSLLIPSLFLLAILSKVKKQSIFLGIWFFSAIVIYFVTGGEDLSVDIIQYHPNAGLSFSLIIFVSYVLYALGKKTNYVVTIVMIIFISLLNFSLIYKINPYGSMAEINAQSFMLLSDEKKVLDYIYQDAAGEPFAVKGVTMPYIINTTWSYLFEWYGQQRYGYLPTWNGKNALGYPGGLRVEEAQGKLPMKRYLIIEPSRGIPRHLINNYLQEESYFTNIIDEKKIGEFVIQRRLAK